MDVLITTVVFFFLQYSILWMKDFHEESNSPNACLQEERDWVLRGDRIDPKPHKKFPKHFFKTTFLIVKNGICKQLFAYALKILL